VALGREDLIVSLCDFEAAAICCVALQPLKIKWRLLSREHRLLSCMQEQDASLRCKETISEYREVMRKTRKSQK
jgi:hypothetical protein